jgi:hypothetical protein
MALGQGKGTAWERGRGRVMAVEKGRGTAWERGRGRVWAMVMAS